MLKNIERAKYVQPTPIQRYAIPIVAKGRDLMACAQTGSGKTAAYLLPILSKFLLMKVPPVPYGKSSPLVLILSPTRELACQIYNEARKFAYTTWMTSAVVYGGIPINTQFDALERGCTLLVATPGRLLDLYNKNKVSLSRVQFLVLDEADRMLDMGFEPQVRKIVSNLDLPPKNERQTLMFSATFPNEIQQLASNFLNEYIFLTVGRVGSTADMVTQKFVEVEDYRKDQVLVDILRKVKGLTLIFVETKKKAEELESFLLRNNFSVNSIHGDRSQKVKTTKNKFLLSKEETKKKTIGSKCSNSFIFCWNYSHFSCYQCCSKRP